MVTNILVKAMTQFPSPQFALAMHLLHGPIAMGLGSVGGASGELHEAVAKLRDLAGQLEGAQYARFWATLDSDDLYADLTADVAGFEDLMRMRIAGLVGQAYREVGADKLEAWLGLRGPDATKRFATDVAKWAVKDDGATIAIPLNADNEAKKAEIREDVNFEMFARVVRRSWEEQAP